MDFVGGIADPVLRRSGRQNPQTHGAQSLWSLTLFVPLASYFGLWIFAFKRWPVDDKRDGAEPLADVEA
jgi:hypothetical protein